MNIVTNRQIPFLAVFLAVVCAAVPASTQVLLVEDINEGTGGSWGGWPEVLGARVVFSADDGVHGAEPWVWVTDDINPETPDTFMLKDAFVSDPSGNCGNTSEAKRFTKVGDVAYFFAIDHWEASWSFCAHTVWKTDGTTAGTLPTSVVAYRVYDNSYAEMGGVFYLRGWDESTGEEIWKIDGGNQYMIADVRPGTSSSEPLAFSVVDLDGLGDRLFFTAQDGVEGNHPWISDGTPGGTQRLKIINTVVADSYTGLVTGFQGKGWFKASDGVNGVEPWTTDGTEENTTLFMDIFATPPEHGSNPGLFLVVGDQLFFSATSDYRGFRLWVTDGTVGNTHEVVETEPGVAPDSLETMAAFNGKMYFSDSLELWVSDGTEAGTFAITDFDSDSSPSDPEDLTVADGKLYFSAVTPDHGRELWVSNGTAAGTMLVEDIYPGETSGTANSSWPRDFVQVGDMLFFFATDGTYGNEPRKLQLTDFVTTPDAPTGPESGPINTTHSFVAGGAISLEGDDVQYRFHWGDGSDPSDWLTVGATSADHQWTEPGTYFVTVEARAASDTSVVSRTSTGFEVEMLYDETISGASITGDSVGWVGNEYAFTIDATSSKGHAMEFQVDWGDGPPSAWTALGAEGSQVSHSWATAGPYQITATVRCAEHTEAVDDDDHSITISNETLSDPTLVGPETGGNGISYTYTLSASSNAGHDLEYWVSWGDGDPTPDIDWAPFGEGVTSVQLSHAWPELGGYEVYAQVRCAAHPTTLKDVTLWVSLEEEYIENVTLSGPTIGYTNHSYAYTISGESTWGHDLEYAVSWGDGEGNDIDWTPFPPGKSTVTVSYAWTFEAPDFPVWAGVRCATHTELEGGDDMLVAISDGPVGLIFSDGFETGDSTQW